MVTSTKSLYKYKHNHFTVYKKDMLGTLSILNQYRYSLYFFSMLSKRKEKRYSKVADFEFLIHVENGRLGISSYPDRKFRMNNSSFLY